MALTGIELLLHTLLKYSMREEPHEVEVLNGTERPSHKGTTESGSFGRRGHLTSLPSPDRDAASQGSRVRTHPASHRRH